MIAPNGTVLARTGVFTPALLDMRLPLRDPLTIADRVGPWPEWILTTAGLLALAVALVAQLRRRPQRSAEPEAGEEAAVEAQEPVVTA